MNEDAYRAILRRLGVDQDRPQGEHHEEDSELTRRVAAFRRLIEGWAHAGKAGVPLIVLPDAPEPRLGSCISCGAPIQKDGWRCSLCLRAVEIVLGLPPSEAGP